jgi:hypothetical protein
VTTPPPQGQQPGNDSGEESGEPADYDPYRFGAPSPNPFGYPSSAPGQAPPPPAWDPAGPNPPPYGGYPPTSGGYPGANPGQYPPPDGGYPGGGYPSGPPNGGYPGGYPGGPNPPPNPYQYNQSPYNAQQNQYQYPGAPAAKNTKANVALILGIISIPFSIFSLLDLPVAIVGIIFGVLGARASQRGLGGRNKAIWGLILAVIGLILAILLTVFVAHRWHDCSQIYDTGSHDWGTCMSNGN